MSLRTNYPGVHFKDPWLMEPDTMASSSLGLYPSGATRRTADTTIFWTGLTNFGIQDNTDWTANTYKTIYSHTGKGLIYAMIGPTAGGAETTTFEITIDGVLSTITVTNANTQRAVLVCGGLGGATGDEFTTATSWQVANGALDAGTQTTFQTASETISPLKWHANAGVPVLRYDISCLIRMKHSTSITNSVATSYSGVMVRKGIAA